MRMARLVTDRYGTEYFRQNNRVGSVASTRNAAQGAGAVRRSLLLRGLTDGISLLDAGAPIRQRNYCAVAFKTQPSVEASIMNLRYGAAPSIALLGCGRVGAACPSPSEIYNLRRALGAWLG